MIRVIDYGVGNTQAFLTLFKRQGIVAAKACAPDDLRGAKGFILPGVGHFDHAMTLLNDSGLRPYLETMVMEDFVPIMGVCVGMQMLADKSEEGTLPGLGWISGTVKSFASNSLIGQLPMPHMGWNTLEANPLSQMFQKGFDNTPQFYFLHSFYFEANDKNDVVATATYGFDFDVAVSRNNIHGVQCHPEKSHHWGAQLLKNFAEFN